MGMVYPRAKYDWHCDPNQTSVDVAIKGVKLVTEGEAHFVVDANGQLWQHNVPEHSLDGGWVLVNGDPQIAQDILEYMHNIHQVPLELFKIDGTTQTIVEQPAALVQPIPPTEPITSPTQFEQQINIV